MSAIWVLICFFATLVFGLQVADSVSYDALALTCPRKTEWVQCSLSMDCRALSVAEYYDFADSCKKIYLEINWPYFIKLPKLLQGPAYDSSTATLTLTDNTGAVWTKDYVFYNVGFTLPDSIIRQWQGSVEFQNLSSLPPKYNVAIKILDERDGKDITSSSKINIYAPRAATGDHSKRNAIKGCRQLLGNRLFGILTKDISESLRSAYSPGVYKIDIFNDGYFPLRKDLMINRNQSFLLRLKKIPNPHHPGKTLTDR
ncbi:MAG: hypothetical protein PHC61_00560 [Chitinivibrionales bacterium]|nr:hypothetical protein [Chitinivibrionales bacterium]